MVNRFREKAYGADGFVFGSPVHYGAVTGNMTSFMDWLFYSELGGNGNRAFYMKPAAAVLSARRAGTTEAFDQMNKYLPFRRCRWYLPGTGTWFMGQCRNRSRQSSLILSGKRGAG